VFHKFENKHFFEVVRRDGKVVVEVFSVGALQTIVIHRSHGRFVDNLSSVTSRIDTEIVSRLNLSFFHKSDEIRDTINISWSNFLAGITTEGFVAGFVLQGLHLR